MIDDIFIIGGLALVLAMLCLIVWSEVNDCD